MHRAHNNLKRKNLNIACSLSVRSFKTWQQSHTTKNKAAGGYCGTEERFSGAVGRRTKTVRVCQVSSTWRQNDVIGFYAAKIKLNYLLFILGHNYKLWGSLGGLFIRSEEMNEMDRTSYVKKPASTFIFSLQHLPKWAKFPPSVISLFSPEMQFYKRLFSL